MAINSQVFKAIPAMDSYNRGVKPKIVDPNLTGTQIGSASVRADIQLSDDSEPASFSASVYTYNGETIISYRGTDTYTDVLTGWAVGAGFYGSQAELAIKLYQAVQAQVGGGKVTLTGHSLGGAWPGWLVRFMAKKPPCLTICRLNRRH